MNKAEIILCVYAGIQLINIGIEISKKDKIGLLYSIVILSITVWGFV